MCCSFHNLVGSSTHEADWFRDRSFDCGDSHGGECSWCDVSSGSENVREVSHFKVSLFTHTFHFDIHSSDWIQRRVINLLNYFVFVGSFLNHIFNGKKYSSVQENR